MNCKYHQEKIVELLAAGEDLPTAEVAAHQNSCISCTEFYATQQKLFHSVDAGLRFLVDQPVPPSLLPAVRARLDDIPVARRAWIPRWPAVVVAAVAILALTVSYALRRPANHPSAPENTLIASGSVDNPQPAAQLPNVRAKLSPMPRRRPAVPGNSATATSEVIVLAEERQAFARFVAEVPEERDVAVALTRPAPSEADDPVEIALLQIDGLDVKPLESMARE